MLLPVPYFLHIVAFKIFENISVNPITQLHGLCIYVIMIHINVLTPQIIYVFRSRLS